MDLTEFTFIPFTSSSQHARERAQRLRLPLQSPFDPVLLDLAAEEDGHVPGGVKGMQHCIIFQPYGVFVPVQCLLCCFGGGIAFPLLCRGLQCFTSSRTMSLSYSLWPAGGSVAKNEQYASTASTYRTFEHSSQPNTQAYHTI